MKYRHYSIVLILLFLMFFFAVACEKDDTTDFIRQAEIVAEYVKSEGHCASLFVLFHKALHDTALMNHGENHIDSAKVAFEQNQATGNMSFHFDYGSIGTKCPDGKWRRGQVEAVLDQSFTNAGATFSSFFSNYLVDSSRIDGNFSYKNTGELSGELPLYRIVCEMTIINGQKDTITFAFDRPTIWINGFDKPYDIKNHLFIVDEGATAVYRGIHFRRIPVTMVTTITGEWEIVFKCDSPISKGEFNTEMNVATNIFNLTGEYVDIDDDGCIEKVLLKNFDNSFGYPVYL